MKQFFLWIIDVVSSLADWLFDCEFGWWWKARRYFESYQSSDPFKRARTACLIKGWILLFLGLVVQFGYVIILPTLSYLILIGVSIASLFITLFGLFHIFAARTKPLAKNKNQ